MPAKRKSSGRSRKESPDGNELLTMELQEIHSAETQLTRALPRLAKTARTEKLRRMLQERQQQGERLIGEIESAVEQMGEKPGRKKNIAAEGLINDARQHVQEIAAGPALDSVLVAAIQKTEHYCIAAWGTAKSLAQAAGQRTVVRSMERALKEGRTLDERLTQLAERELTPSLLSGAQQATGRSRKSSSAERRALA